MKDVLGIQQLQF